MGWLDVSSQSRLGLCRADHQELQADERLGGRSKAAAGLWGGNWECVYFNTHHAAEAEDWGRRYLRVTRKRDSIQTRHKLLNHTHSQFRGAVENLLASLFPHPSAVEK